MKRYLVFAGEDYYPAGGWRDFRSDHDTVDEAALAAKPWTGDTYRWAHIIDSESTPRPIDGYVDFDDAGGSVAIRDRLDAPTEPNCAYANPPDRNENNSV